MLQTLPCFPEMINSPARQIGARVELFEGSHSLAIYTYNDALKEFSIERMGEDGKFFGFGVCQKLKVTLVDHTRAINITKNQYLEVEFGVGCEYLYPFPLFRVEDVSRNENTNDITVVAYDPIYDSSELSVADISFKRYTIRDFATACAALMGLPVDIDSMDEAFDTLYVTSANFAGTESIREALNMIAEATQTIYFINHKWELTFKRLDRDGEPVINIDKTKYFTLTNQTSRTISSVVHVTELGDNVGATSGQGITQYVRNNAFWELRNDIGALVDAALARVKGLTIHQFNCSWRGNFAVEIGDKLSFITKDNEVVYSYLLNDTISYNGGLKQQTSWSFTDHESETEHNPTSLGEALKQTYARVDKANQRIDLVVSKAEANSESISQLSMSTNEITAYVERVEQAAQSNFNNVNGEIESLTQRVEATMTAEDLTIAVKQEISNGVDKVTTSTGFTFNDVGLTVSKSGSEMTTTITEDGMSVYRDGSEVLTADNTGVKAENLHATTYLIIGENSRFEDYEGNRTGCFWIGGLS